MGWDWSQGGSSTGLKCRLIYFTLERGWVSEKGETFHQQSVPLQVIRKAEDKEKEATVEAKELILTVAGGRCRKRVLLRALQASGEINVCFSWKIKFSSGLFSRVFGFAHHHPSLHFCLLSRCNLLLQHG